MKLLVETTGDFMIMDTSFNQEVAPDRPSVVEGTSYINGRIGNDQLKLLGKVVDAATDAEFAEHFFSAEGDSALAVASFLSSFGLEELTAKSAVKPSAKAK